MAELGSQLGLPPSKTQTSLILQHCFIVTRLFSAVIGTILPTNQSKTGSEEKHPSPSLASLGSELEDMGWPVVDSWRPPFKRVPLP